MADPIPFHVASVNDADADAVLKVLKSGWLTTGPVVREFEAAFARYVHSAHAVALNSCTAALHLALAAAGVQAGDEVIVPTMTFAATGEVVAYFNARPVLVDSDPATGNLDVACVERAFGPRTRAVIAVHFAGHPAELDRLGELCSGRGVALVEDAAHALPASYRGRPIGSGASVACFSFYATKTITTGEGGMVTTGSAEMADRIRTLSLHGLTRDAWKRYASGGSWRYDIGEAGFKYNLTDIAAALGLSQLGRCDSFRASRARIAAAYTAAFSAERSLETPVCLPHVEHAWHLYVLRLRLERLTMTRDEFLAALQQAGIGVSVHFIPLHHHSLYQRVYGYSIPDFPVANGIFDRCLSLPIYPGMSDAQVDRVIGTVLDLAKGATR